MFHCEITQEDIDASTPGETRDPICRAWERLFPGATDCVVTKGCLMFGLPGIGPSVAFLPNSLAAFYKAFHRGEKPGPTAFDAVVERV